MTSVIPIPPGVLRRIEVAVERSAPRWHRDHNMAPDRRLLGRLGEYVCMVACGLGDAFDLDEAYLGYDGGVDVRLVDVKALTESRTTLMRTVDSVTWTRWYLAVRIVADRTGGIILGYASRRELQAAPVVDVGHGASYSLPLTQLHEGLPPPLRWEEQCDGCGALLDPAIALRWGSHTYCCKPCSADEPCGCLA